MDARSIGNVLHKTSGFSPLCNSGVRCFNFSKQLVELHDIEHDENRVIKLNARYVLTSEKSGLECKAW